MPPPFVQTFGGSQKLATWNAKSLSRLIGMTRSRKAKYLERLASQLHVLLIQETHMFAATLLVECAPVCACFHISGSFLSQGMGGIVTLVSNR